MNLWWGGSPQGDAREGHMRAEAMVPDGGTKATLFGSLWITLKWCPKARIALRSWPSLRYLLEVWADVMGSNELILLLGEDHSRSSQGCRVQEKNLEDMRKGHTSFFPPFWKRHLVPRCISPSFLDTHFSIFICQMIFGHSLQKAWTYWNGLLLGEWLYILWMLCSNGMLQGKKDDTILFFIVS